MVVHLLGWRRWPSPCTDSTNNVFGYLDDGGLSARTDSVGCIGYSEGGAYNMNRREFLAAAGVSALSQISTDVDEADRLEEEYLYLVAEHRADADDVHYIVRVDGQGLDATDRQSKAFVMAAVADKQLFPDKNSPDQVVATIARKLDRRELRIIIRNNDVYRIKDQVLGFQADSPS